MVSSSGRAAGDQLLDQRPHLEATAGIEPGRRLVEEQHRRGGDQAGGEIEPAPHAAGVGLDDAAGCVGQAEPLKKLVGAALRIGLREAIEAGDHLEVLAAGQDLVERGVLTGQPDPAADLTRVGEDIEAGDLGAACVRPGQGREDADQRRLPGPVRAEDAEDRAFGHLDADASQGVGRAERLFDLVRKDHEWRHRQNSLLGT